MHRIDGGAVLMNAVGKDGEASTGELGQLGRMPHRTRVPAGGEEKAEVNNISQTVASFRLAAGRSARPSSATSRGPPTQRSHRTAPPEMGTQPAVIRGYNSDVLLTSKGVDKAIDAAVARAIELEELRARDRMVQDPAFRNTVRKHKASIALREWATATADDSQHRRVSEYWADSRPHGPGTPLTQAAAQPSRPSDLPVHYNNWAHADTSTGSFHTGAVEDVYSSTNSGEPVPMDGSADAEVMEEKPTVSRSGVAAVLARPPADPSQRIQPNYELLKGLGIDIEPKPRLLDSITATPSRPPSACKGNHGLGRLPLPLPYLP